MSDLIARLEAATEGSRELDAEIEATLPLRTRQRNAMIPAYTRSLDAALTLVPEGWYGRVWFGNSPLPCEAGEYRASIWSLDRSVREAFFGQCSKAATPALALCVIAVKARLSLAANSLTQLAGTQAPKSQEEIASPSTPTSSLREPGP